MWGLKSGLSTISIHSETLNTKLGKPAGVLKWSNSTTLKLGLLIDEQFQSAD